MTLPTKDSWAVQMKRERDEARRDCEHLNQMIRETGQGQGAIDAYVAQCEELDALRQQVERLREELRGMAWRMPPWKSRTHDLNGDALDATGEDVPRSAISWKPDYRQGFYDLKSTAHKALRDTEPKETTDENR